MCVAEKMLQLLVISLTAKGTKSISEQNTCLVSSLHSFMWDVITHGYPNQKTNAVEIMPGNNNIQYILYMYLVIHTLNLIPF